MAKLLLMLVAIVGFANSMFDRAQPPLLIDNAAASATPLDAQP